MSVIRQHYRESGGVMVPMGPPTERPGSLYQHWMDATGALFGYPWEHPDPPAFPCIDLFPTWTRTVARLREGRRRVALAWAALTEGDL